MYMAKIFGNLLEEIQYDSMCHIFFIYFFFLINFFLNITFA